MTTEFQPTASSVSLSSEATQGGDDAPLPKWTNDAQPSLQPISQSTANNAQHGTPFSLLVGCAQAVGSRDYQQDTFTITDNGYLASHTDASTSAEATLPKHALLCVFDGHGSATYAEHAAGNIHRLVTEHPAFHSGNYPLALAQGFALEDRELFEEVHAEERRGGTTATVALIVDELLCGFSSMRADVSSLLTLFLTYSITLLSLFTHRLQTLPTSEIPAPSSPNAQENPIATPTTPSACLRTTKLPWVPTSCKNCVADRTN